MPPIWQHCAVAVDVTAAERCLSLWGAVVKLQNCLSLEDVKLMTRPKCCKRVPAGVGQATGADYYLRAAQRMMAGLIRHMLLLHNRPLSVYEDAAHLHADLS